MTDAARSDAAAHPAGNSGGGNGGDSGAGGAGGAGDAGGAGGDAGGHRGSGGGKGEKKKCAKCKLLHYPNVACWEVCALCGWRHHFRAPCQRAVQDPHRSLVEENRALHERNRILEQELAHVRGQLNTQMQIANLQQQQLQQGAQGSIYGSPFSLSQPVMQPQALCAGPMIPHRFLVSGTIPQWQKTNPQLPYL